MLKKHGTWIALVALWGIIWAAQKVFAIPDQMIWIVTIMFFVAVGIYHFESRLQVLEERVVRKDYNGILQELKGERHIPKHQQPESLAAAGAIKGWTKEPHEILFDDFRWWAPVLNQNVSDPWSIEEINDIELRGYDGPAYGRKFHVWYNACEVGRMQVAVGGFRILKPEAFADDRCARVDLELSYLRFIPFDDATSLISTLALFIKPFDFDNTELSHEKARAAASDVLAGYLWDAVRLPDVERDFDYKLEGPYSLLRHTVEHWKKSGIDPMVKWQGDRSW
ncbi:hypothetical protein ELI43_24360 [Rhizobium leguminosarum]|uniref:hypothetical protein n=1 Tax=Rhizobium leguminosarum TaxID=384 RepID=UPI00102F5056|nr:hypothetical protein [Rhizobium leguminosarum]TAU55735.1 hypothetical protein ELI43_24360 [Rhizobium leguminosarum]